VSRVKRGGWEQWGRERGEEKETRREGERRKREREMEIGGEGKSEREIGRERSE
jgi:hypothetical protein